MKPFNILKSITPKLVPFFKTVVMFFVLYGSSESSSILFCIAKCLPIISLIFFVVIHGMSLNEYYRYSRTILTGLIFSVFGDAFLVWKDSYMNFELGLIMFALAQLNYTRAFGIWPLNPYAGGAFVAFGLAVYSCISSSLTDMMKYLGPFYIVLICTMGWRAVARVQLFDDLFTWTKLCSCAGAIFFIISDLLISVDMFIMSIPFSHQIIMATYYGAQLGIALSVVDSPIDEVIRIQTKDQNPDVIDDLKGHLKSINRENVRVQLEHLSHRVGTVKGNLSHRVDTVKGNLSHRVDTVKGNLSHRVDTVKGNLSHRVDAVKGNLSHHVDAVKGNVSNRVDIVRGNLSHHVDTVRENLSHHVDTMKENMSNHVDIVRENLSHQVDMVKENFSHQVCSVKISLSNKVDSVKDRLEHISNHFTIDTVKVPLDYPSEH